MITESIFRSYDVRGIFKKELTVDKAERIGRSYGRYIGSGTNVGVAIDTRPSSEKLKKHLITGIISEGCNVIDLGVVPTPLLYFSIKNLKLDGGVMVTASHLPPKWNGFKFCDANGLLVFEKNGLADIKILYDKNEKRINKLGKITEYKNTFQDYEKAIVPMIKTRRRLKVVIDYGNGAASLVVPKLLDELDFKRIDLNRKLNAAKKNIDYEPSETSLNRLRTAVIDNKADIGIAFDGDGDRLVFVDEKGDISSNGNTTLQLFSKYYLDLYRCGKVVFDVTCSSAVSDYVKKLGGTPIVSHVGVGYCTQAAIKNGAIFYGEYSGHIGLPEMSLRDDAIFAGLKLLQMVSSSGSSLSSMLSALPKYFESEKIEIPCKDTLKFNIIKRIKNLAKEQGFRFTDIDGVKILKNEGWVLIRASNTSPIIRINAEGKTGKNASEMQRLGKNLINQAIKRNVIKQAVILAAGKGKRMKKGQTDKFLFDTPKPLLEISGEPIIERSVKLLTSNDIEVAIVINPKDEKKFRKKLGKYKVKYYYQKKAKGTANALLMAKKFIKDKLFFVLMGDDIFDSDINELLNSDTASIFCFKVRDISGYGKVIIDKNEIAKEIFEKTGSGAGLANTGIYVLPKTFFNIYRDLKPNQNTGEYYLTDIVKILYKKGEGLRAKKINFWRGINTYEDLVAAQNL